MAVQKYPGETLTVTASMEFRGAAGSFAFEFSLAAPGVSTAVASGRQTFTTPLSVGWAAKSVAAAATVPNVPTGSYTLWAAIKLTDDSGRNLPGEVLLKEYPAAVTVVAATEFQKFAATAG